jgi:hypothetical protein
MNERTLTQEELEQEESDYWLKNHKKISSTDHMVASVEGQMEAKRKEKKKKEIQDKRYQ